MKTEALNQVRVWKLKTEHWLQARPSQMQVCAMWGTHPPGPQGHLDQGVGCDRSLGYLGNVKMEQLWGEMKRMETCPGLPLPFSLLLAHPSFHGITWRLCLQNSLMNPECGSKWSICNWSPNPCIYFKIAQRFSFLFFFLNGCFFPPQGFLFDAAGRTRALLLSFCLLFYLWFLGMGWSSVVE